MIIKNYSFENKYVKLESDRIEIPDKGITIVIGENGAGKSSFIEDIIFNDVGMEFESEKLEKMFQEDRMSIFSYVSQSIPKPAISVEWYLKSVSSEISDKEIMRLLSRFNIGKSILQKKMDKLSGGEAMKICIISALLKETQYVFLDEPTNNLDDKAVEELIEIIKDASFEKAIIIVSHDERMQRITKNVISISNGLIVSDTFKEKVAECAVQKGMAYRDVRSVSNKLVFSNSISILFCLMTAILIIILAVFNKFEFDSDYALKSGLDENAIMSYLVDYSFGELNNEYAKSAGLKIKESDYDNMLTYDDVRELSHDTNITDIFIMDEKKCDELINLLEEDKECLFSIPEQISVNFSNVIGLKDILLLTAGHAPSDGTNDIVISENAVKEKFNVEKVENCIGKTVEFDGVKYVISGISPYEICWRGYCKDDSSLFYVYDDKSYDSFVKSSLEYKEKLDYTFIGEVNNVMFVTKNNKEAAVLNMLISSFPADNYYSNEFDNIWVKQHNVYFMIKLMAINLVIIIAFIALIFRLLRVTIKMDSEYIAYMGMVFVDRKKVLDEYMRSRRLLNMVVLAIVIITGILCTIKAPMPHHIIVAVEAVILFGIPELLYNRRMKVDNTN